MSIPFCRTPTAAWSEISLYDGYSGHEERTGQPGIRAQGPEKVKGKSSVKDLKRSRVGPRGQTSLLSLTFVIFEILSELSLINNV